MTLVQRPLADGDLDQVWELRREAFNDDPVHREWAAKWERAIGPERLEGLLLDGRLVAMSGVLHPRRSEQS